MTDVLVVEDDIQLARALAINLKARTYDVDTAPDGATALSLVTARRPDAVLVDLGLPDMDGIDLIRALRGWSRLPILVLSARREAEEKVAPFEAGCDDYVTKPFDMAELLARLRAALRRADGADTSRGNGNDHAAEGPAVVATDGFAIDLVAKKVTRGSSPVRLTPTEWHVLEILVHNPGRLVSQRRLLEEVWGPSCRSRTNYLRVYMAQLRRKLEEDPSHPRYLVTEPGMGYRFEQ